MGSDQGPAELKLEAGVPTAAHHTAKASKHGGSGGNISSVKALSQALLSPRAAAGFKSNSSTPRGAGRDQHISESPGQALPRDSRTANAGMHVVLPPSSRSSVASLSSEQNLAGYAAKSGGGSNRPAWRPNSPRAGVAPGVAPKLMLNLSQLAGKQGSTTPRAAASPAGVTLTSLRPPRAPSAANTPRSAAGGKWTPRSGAPAPSAAHTGPHGSALLPNSASSEAYFLRGEWSSPDLDRQDSGSVTVSGSVLSSSCASQRSTRSTVSLTPRSTKKSEAAASAVRHKLQMGYWSKPEGSPPGIKKQRSSPTGRQHLGQGDREGCGAGDQSLPERQLPTDATSVSLSKEPVQTSPHRSASQYCCQCQPCALLDFISRRGQY